MANVSYLYPLYARPNVGTNQVSFYMINQTTGLEVELTSANLNPLGATIEISGCYFTD